MTFDKKTCFFFNQATKMNRIF